MLTLHKDLPAMPKSVSDVAHSLSTVGFEVLVVPSHYSHTPLEGYHMFVGKHRDKSGHECALFDLGFFHDGTLEDYNNDSGALHKSYPLVQPVPPVLADIEM
jgi:hypothetical protein